MIAREIIAAENCSEQDASAAARPRVSKAK
jgi:hypothetical protein